MRFYFDETTQWEAQVQDVLGEINRIGLPLVLFGRSKTTDPAFLEAVRVPVQYVCCNTPASWGGGKFWKLDVINPAQIGEIYHAYTVLVLAVEVDQEIQDQLRSLPVPPAAVFQLDLHWGIRDSHMPKDSADYFQKRQAEANRIYDLLSDQESKDTYEAVIRYRMNRDRNILAPVKAPFERKYLPESLDGTPFLERNEVFLNAGAFTGDTVQKFIQASSGEYQHIYAIEPEEQNYQQLLKNMEALQNVTCLKRGLGEQAQQLYSTSFGKGSMVVTDGGGESIEIDSLDHLLGDTPVTYITLDIEGMECPALRGAKNLIRKYRPKLAICCYHSDEDMLEVPKEILHLDPSYRLYMRHYTSCLNETVCYAI